MPAEIRLPVHRPHRPTARDVLERHLPGHWFHTVKHKAKRHLGKGWVCECECGSLFTVVLEEEIAGLSLVAEIAS